MAIALESSVGATANFTQMWLGWPNTTAGHVAIFMWRGRYTWTQEPAGFTQLDEINTSGGRSRVYYRILTGGESGDIEVGANTSHKMESALSVFSGVDTSSIFNNYSVSTSNNGSFPSVSTSVADCGIVLFGSHRDGTLRNHSYPSGYTRRQMLGTAGGGAVSTSVGDSISSRGAGTVNPGSMTLNGGSWNHTHKWTMALTPLEDEPPPPPVLQDSVGILIG